MVKSLCLNLFISAPQINLGSKHKNRTHIQFIGNASLSNQFVLCETG